MNHGEMIFDGDTSAGIRVLQGGYEAQRLHEESVRAAGRVPNTRITDVLVASDAAIGEKIVPAGSDMTVSFNYEVIETEEPFVAELTIETLQGALVYGFSTRLLDQALPNTPGRHQVDFTFTDPALGIGEYVLRGTLETMNGELLHQLNPASTFSVSGASMGIGALRMDLRTHVHSLPSN